MRKQWIVILTLAFLTAPALSQAEPFSVVGPRALGMGGASVAAVNDSTAVYWNPAALADFRKVDIRIPVEIGASDHVGLKDTWDRLNEIRSLVDTYDPTAINETISLLQELNKPGAGADMDASAGLLISIPIAKSAIAVSAMGLGYAGLYPVIDTLHSSPTVTIGLSLNPDFVGNNNSAVSSIGVMAMEPAVSFATSFGEKLFIGANAKMIYASTYVNSQYMKSDSFNTFADELKNSRTESSKAALDAGILYAPIESFRVGVVGRDLNSPSFAYEGVVAQRQASGDVTLATATKGEVVFDPQYRAGLAWRPFKTLTVAADYDLTRNKTLTPGYDSQTAAVGLEKTFLAEYLNLRLGANKNMADSGAKTVYTAGLGLRFFALRFDLAGGYDFDKRQGEASLDLALRF